MSRGGLIVGAGLMGSWHAQALRRLGHAVVGVVDQALDLAEGLADQHGAPAFRSVEEALRATVPEVVHVCTPTATHGTLVRTSLDSGCHVLVEKPVTESARETDELLQLAARTGRHLVPVHQFLFQRGVLVAQARTPSLGPIRHADFETCSAGAEGTGLDPDAVVRDILPHPLSLFHRVLGLSVADRRWTVHHPRAGEFRALTDADGLVATILVSMSGRPTRNALRLIGEQGTVSIDLFHGYDVLQRGAVSRGRKVLQPFSASAATFGRAATNLLRRSLTWEPAYPGLRELVRRLYLTARTAEPPPITSEETLAVAVARERLLEAMRG